MRCARIGRRSSPVRSPGTGRGAESKRHRFALARVRSGCRSAPGPAPPNGPGRSRDRGEKHPIRSAGQIRPGRASTGVRREAGPSGAAIRRFRLAKPSRADRCRPRPGGAAWRTLDVPPKPRSSSRPPRGGVTLRNDDRGTDGATPASATGPHAGNATGSGRRSSRPRGKGRPLGTRDSAGRDPAEDRAAGEAGRTPTPIGSARPPPSDHDGDGRRNPVLSTPGAIRHAYERHTFPTALRESVGARGRRR
jgi:hypothetical protein